MKRQVLNLEIEQQKYNELIELINSSDKFYDTQLIETAYVFSKQHHNGQYRQSGEPYICHPIEVAKIIVGLGFDNDSVVASLLHDIVEDTDVTLDELKTKFGSEIASLVDGVTKLGKIAYSSKEEQQMEYLRKMFFAMANDIRVIVIKLADRLHNMRTLGACDNDKQLRISLETIEIFAPLSHRLGMRKLKIELEDTSLMYLDPVGYNMIKRKLESTIVDKNKFINNICDQITDRLNEYKLNFKLEHRIKHIFSIYKKIFTQNKTFEELYDIYAFRIICDNVNDCYYILGLMHDLYNPIPGRFKDYISTPKPNMYQSLHTTVIGKDGIPFEVQIRTWEMHKTAEYGIAAHWKYKDGISKSNVEFDSKLTWVRNIIETQDDLSGTEDLLKSLKVDLFSDEVFVFTPKGDVVNLPAGSNVIDFAYAIHSAVGNRMIGAKVNGKIVNLDYTLSNGEIIEIITTSSANHGPSRNWLKMVKTNEARSKIRQWFKKERREENISEGVSALEHELKSLGVSLDDPLTDQQLLNVCESMHFSDVDDMYAAIGYGGTSAQKIAVKVRDALIRLKNTEEIRIVPQPKKKVSDGGVSVEGIDNCLIKFAKCCNPLPGDFIIGYITKGYGVSIHNINCPNAKRGLEQNPDRWLKASWENSESKYFTAMINIEAKNAVGVMAKVASALADMKVSVRNFNARDNGDDTATISVAMDVKNVDHLNFIISKLKKNKLVIDITRINH